MRFIDKTGCKSAFEKGKDSSIQSLGKLTKTACRIAEQNKLGLLKTRQGCYRVIKESGLGAYEDFFTDLISDIIEMLFLEECGKYTGGIEVDETVLSTVPSMKEISSNRYY